LIEPNVHLIGHTQIDSLDSILEHIDVPAWHTDANSDGELLTEFMGRLCYNSFEVGLNPNVTRIREGNETYNQNIIRQLHGSVLEHVVLNFVFTNVSTVFTQELIRHRAGTAISQESRRYVRYDELGDMLIPPEIANNESANYWYRMAVSCIAFCYRMLIKCYDWDSMPFAEKKKVTSAIRRIIPVGYPTIIGWSANIRTLRHVIEMRTHPSAEYEMRLVFSKVSQIVSERYPSLFADYEIEIVDDMPWYKTENRKV
jgi:thymidylate synthase (FAD)